MRSKFTFEEAEELFAYLQGETPKDFQGNQRIGNTLHQPKLDPRTAFNIIYILQEKFRLIPDTYEMCDECNELYNSDEGGDHLDDGHNYCESCVDRHRSKCALCGETFDTDNLHHILVSEETSRENRPVGLYKILTRPFFYGNIVTGFDDFFDDAIQIMKAGVKAEDPDDAEVCDSCAKKLDPVKEEAEK